MRTNKLFAKKVKQPERSKEVIKWRLKYVCIQVYRSNQHIYVQIVDDTKGHTLVAASTSEEGVKGSAGASIVGSTKVGALIAKRSLAKGIDKVVFDRSGYLYHGRIKALADSAREGGLQF